jgi:hypothetical protein
MARRCRSAAAALKRSAPASSPINSAVSASEHSRSATATISATVGSFVDGSTSTVVPDSEAIA